MPRVAHAAKVACERAGALHRAGGVLELRRQVLGLVDQQRLAQDLGVRLAAHHGAEGVVRRVVTHGVELREAGALQSTQPRQLGACVERRRRERGIECTRQ